MYNKAIEFIGAHIQVYGHFEVYAIPDENGVSISNETEITKDDFLRLTLEYFTDKTRINYNYGDDLKDQNAIKRFIKNRINSDSLNLGVEWLNNHSFKAE